MPRIVVPRSDPTLPRAIFSGDQFGAQQGRALEGLGREVSDIGDAMQRRQQQRDVSRLTAEFATAQAELAVEWQETIRTADPNDPEVAERFRRERVESRLQQIRDMADTRAGRDYFTTASAGLGASFLTTTESGQARLAEVAAVQNWQTINNRLGDALTAMPESFQDTLGVGRLHLQGLVQANGLSSEQALKLDSELSQSLAFAAARGVIDRDPEVGKTAVDLGEYAEFLSVEQKQRLLDYADSQVAAREVAFRKQQERIARETTTEYLQAAVSPNGRVNAEVLPQLVGSVVRDPRLSADPDTQRTMFNLLRGLADSESGGAAAKTDPATFDSLLSRALLPLGDPNRPTRNEVFAKVGNGLKVADANFLVDRLDQQGDPAEEDFTARTKTAFSTARRFITGADEGIGVQDPLAELNYQSFQSWATGEVRRLKEQGVPSEEILAFDGPIMSQLPRFKRTLSIQEQTQVLRGTANLPVIPPPPATDAATGKPLRNLTPAEMDEWLRRGNQ